MGKKSAQIQPWVQQACQVFSLRPELVVQGMEMYDGVAHG